MNKLYSILFLMLLCTFAQGQSWTIYDADVDPAAFDPAFSESNGAGTNSYATLADPDDGSNNLLGIKTDDDVSSNIQLRQYTDQDAVTVVLKARTVDAGNKGLLFDIDFRSTSSTRFAIKVLNDGTYDIDKGGDGVVEDKGDWGFTSSEWNIFRFTKSGADVNVYLNEDSTPIFTLSAVGTADGNGYWRFGDGWSSHNVDTQYDWVTWDYTGAYAPSDQSLPSELVDTEGNWTVYNADVEPDTFDPAFSESNGAGTNSYATLADPDDGSNNLLGIKTDDDVSSNIQLRQYTDADAVTVVLKARTVDADNKGLLFDIDFRSATSTRFAIKVLNDGTYDIDKGGDGIVEDKGDWGFTSTEWNIFRFTKDGADVNVYLNEDETPIFTLPAAGTADGNGYWRFGDGWSSHNVDTQYDWVTWDYTGAYSPSDQSLPSELVNAEVPLGDWATYNADVDPTAFDPAFSESNGAGTNSYGVIADPVIPGNNLLEIKTDDDVSSNIQLRQYTDADAVTVVLKARTVDADNKGLLFDIDFRSATSTRFAIKVLNDGTYDIDKGGDGIVEDKGDWGFTSTEWNIFRFTKNGADVNVYLNEDTTPIFTLPAVGSADGNGYWRFGDGWSSHNVDTQYDWVSWDYSGAYSPSQTRLPKDLLEPPLGDWTIYQADVDPGAFDPAFSESNGAGTNSYATIADPDDASNNLLEIKTDDDVSSNIQLRQYTDADAVTVVLKARTVDADNKGLLFDIDFRSATSTRFAIKVLNDGTYDIDKGGDGIVEDKGDWGFTSTEWNIFRFTKDGADVNVYLNEDTTPIFTLPAVGSADGNGYWRFGDGWSSHNVDTQFDWVLWDYAGAYSPAQTRLPDELTGTGEATAPSLKTIGSPDPLFQDIGFGPDFTTNSYVVSGKDLTVDITVTPPTNFEVSIDESTWFTTDNPLILTQSSGVVDLTTVFVRLNATAVGDYSGDIINSTEGGESVAVAVSGSAVTQIPELSLIAELNNFSQNVSNPSVAQTYRVSGVNLKGAITVTAPDNFEVSTDEGTTWAATATVTPEVRTITNATVYVRLNASALGTYSGNMVHTATDASEVTLAVSGEVIPDPGITVTGDFTAFTNSVGTASESQSYTIAGTNLASDIEISLPDGFEISFNNELWLTSLSLEPLEGNVDEITLFIRLNGETEGTYTGDVVHASDGVDAVSKSVTGTTDGNVLAADRTIRSLNVWPNPSSNFIVLERADWSGEGQVAIYNMSGSRVSNHLVKTGNAKTELDISSLPKGVYLIEYVSNNNTIKMKFIKE